MKTKSLLMLLMLGLAGCASSGVKVSQDQIDKFERGKTTYAEVVGALGQPTMNTASADGSRMLIYSYANVAARPETFIPIVGAFVGGADTRSSSVAFRFDKSGTLVDWHANQMNIGTGSGLASGTTPNRIPNQPAP